MIVVLAALQGLALLLVIVRLLPGRRRRPPVAPVPEGLEGSSVSVVVATLNEARRIGPCLAGLAKQGAPLREVIVVDSHSKDATPAMVEEIAARDRRFRLVNDPPLPTGWVGKVWALQHGLGEATSEWVLGIDADTEPQPGMVAAVVQAAQAMRYDVVSFAPQFADMTSAEQWLQPSMLLTLGYRFGAAGMADPPPDRVMANGQCFLARREVLLANGGYEVSRQSWADDVTLARWLASRGVRVGFLDGSRLYKVRAYDSLGHMWREWGRSFDLSDATTRVRQWFDVLYIALAQGMPWLVLLAFALGALSAQTPAGLVLLRLNQTLVAIRVLMLLALWGSYERRSMGFWLSPLADPVAAWRLILSTVRRPKGWRGRTFTLGSAPDPSR
ncbi:MAG TPA: glycosyltransferase family 2 protein [Gemmatimonadaceae bacterium]|nr:glycosyltransferase family 2 protein [Gemmatimonadaceae bacterium]